MSSERANHGGHARLIAITATAVIACWARGARADAIGRTLGGHRYVPFSVVDWSFLDSSFGTTVSVGVVHLDEGVALRSTTGGVPRLELLAVGERFEGMAAVAPWLGIHVGATGASTMAIAAGRETPVAVGAQTLLEGEVGAVVRLLRAGRVQLSALGDLTWGRIFTPELLPGSPHVDRDVWTVRPALAAAITLAPTVGVQASGSFELRDVEGQGDRIRRWGAGLGVSLALDPTPVMLLVGGGVAHESENTADRRVAGLFGHGGTEGNGELGAFYHGRSDLDLGAAFVFAVADDDRRYLGHVRMNYYF